MFGRKKASKKVGRKKVATKKAGPKKRVKRAQKEFNKMQKMIDRPSTYENYGRRVSRKSDRASLEGNELSEGTGVRTKSGRVRTMTDAEYQRYQRARRAKYAGLSKADAFSRRRKAAATLKKAAAKRKKKK